MRVFGSSGRDICGFLRICSASACRNLSSAARNWSVSFLISSSLAPRSSASRKRILRLAQRLLGLGDVAVLDLDRHVPHPRHHVAQLVVGPGVSEIAVDRAQAEIDAGLQRELLGRDGERIERGEHDRLLLGVERQVAALLDQRARHRLGEDALRQLDVGRLAAAFVAGLVARDQRHLHVGAGPGVLGEILSGLRVAGARARLRQRQREIGRLEQRMRRLAGGFVRLAREGRLRAGDAVVVLHLVVEAQRAARLPLRLLDQRDGRRLVGDGGEPPGQVGADDAAHRRRAVALDDEAALFGARGQHGVRVRGPASSPP